MQAAVTLSEALRRNAKHEARFFKYLMVIAGAPPEMIRDFFASLRMTSGTMATMNWDALSAI